MVAERIDSRATALTLLPQPSEQGGTPLRPDIPSTPPMLRFHDGTEAGETAYFERVDQAYFYIDENGEKKEKNYRSYDVPLVHDDLKPEGFDEYWQALGAYYDARLAALGSNHWNASPPEQPIFPTTKQPIQEIDVTIFLPISTDYISSYAADE